MTLNIGFIGCGGIAQVHLNNLKQMSGVEVVALCDVNVERAKEEALRWTNAKAFSDVNDMLDAHVLDAVYLCLPPLAHGFAEDAVIERGIPFLVEKPLGLSKEQTLGTLNKIKQKKFNHGGWLSLALSGGCTAGKENPRPANGWNVTRILDGRDADGSMVAKNRRIGRAVCRAIDHIVDLLRYLCGEITEVYACYGEGIIQQRVEGATIADVGTINFKLKNGSVANISNTCVLPFVERIGLELYTDKGLLKITTSGLQEKDRAGTRDYEAIADPFLTEDQAFIEAVRTSNPTSIKSDYEDAAKTLLVTLAANQSAHTGEIVKMKELFYA